MAFRQEPPQSFKDAFELAKKLIARNKNIQSERAIELESESLVSHAFAEATSKRLNRVELFSRFQDRFPPDAGEKLIVASLARAEGIPLQYILSKAAFLDDIFEVKRGVFIPRPETELLVSIAQEDIESNFKSDAIGFEVGLGTGVISISLLKNLPKLKMVATEISPAAIEIATKNAKEFRVESRLKILTTTATAAILEPFKQEVLSQKQRFDFLISNPPYLVRTDSIANDVMKYEPHEALFAGEERPSRFYEEFAEQARELLSSQGRIYLEIPHDRAEAIAEIFAKHKWGCSLHLDLTGRQRFLLVRRLNG